MGRSSPPSVQTAAAASCWKSGLPFQILVIGISSLSVVMAGPATLYSPTYDLNEICSKLPFSLELQPMHKVLFHLNASVLPPPVDPKGSSFPPTSTRRPDVFTCYFSLRTRRSGINTTLELQWHNFKAGCHDYIQIKKPDETFMVYLEASGHQALNLPGTNSIDLYLSVCLSGAPKHLLEIWATTSASASGSSQNDVSSIILAFMAPFAFILLAVVMAVMGSCCCGKKCRRPATGDPLTADSSSSGVASNSGTYSRPSGSRDTLVPAGTSLADKPPAYEDLFPADFIYEQESAKKAPNNPNAATVSSPDVVPTCSIDLATAQPTGATVRNNELTLSASTLQRESARRPNSVRETELNVDERTNFDEEGGASALSGGAEGNSNSVQTAVS